MQKKNLKTKPNKQTKKKPRKNKQGWIPTTSTMKRAVCWEDRKTYLQAHLGRPIPTGTECPILAERGCSLGYVWDKALIVLP